MNFQRMTAEETPWDSNQLRRYNLVLEQIPRLHYQDPKVDELMAANVSTRLYFVAVCYIIKFAEASSNNRFELS